VGHEFTFETDEYADSFFHNVVEEMVSVFGVPRDEAIRRVNRQFAGKRFVGDCIVFHNHPENLAGDILYGKSTHWWTLPKDMRSPRPLDSPPTWVGGGDGV